MELSDAKVRELGRRLLLTRMRMLSEHGFYGLLLMHMKFAIGDELDTAWVSSDTITFNPTFMDSISDDELVFVLEHEVLHACLGHLSRGNDYEDQEAFNVACDIVVNSNILMSNGMDRRSITLSKFGESIHLAPDGREGYEFTAEEVYEMFPVQHVNVSAGVAGTGTQEGALHRQTTVLEDANPTGSVTGWDQHIRKEGGDAERAEWNQHMRNAREAMRRRSHIDGRGLVPRCVERLLGEIDRPKADWRSLLNDFVQEEVFDWSFNTPDRRFPDSAFLLPSYSDVEAAVRDVLFMVDASGSVTDEELTSVLGEIIGAIDQFGGKLSGWIGFFDARAYQPIRFESVEALSSIRPTGGGGTRFEAVFEGIQEHMHGEDVSCIVIMTDGLAPFPDESIACGIPVLWLLTSNAMHPPWGRTAYLSNGR